AEVSSPGTRAAPFAPGERLPGFVAGAPPRCEPAGPRRTRDGCSYRGREVGRLFCRSTASVRTGQAPFAPGTGAPTEGERLAGFFVGAPPRCEPARNHSHPGRVLLRG